MKWSDFLLVLALAFIFFLILKSCGQNGDYRELQLKYEEATHINDSLGRTIVVKDAQIVENQESMKDLRAKMFETTEKYNKKVKEVKALIAMKTKIDVDTFDIPYVDTIGMRIWEDSVARMCRDVIKYYQDSSVMVGTTAKDSTAYYKVDATVEKSGIKMNDIQFIDSQYVSVTEFKGGLLKKDTKGTLKLFLPKRTKIEIKHTNPYFQNTGVDAFFYNRRKNNPSANVFLGGVGLGAVGMLMLLTL